MRVCQINTVYGQGSTGKIVRDLHLALLKNGVDSTVICPEANQLTGEKGVYTVSNRMLSYSSAAYRRLTGRQYDGARLQTRRILSILNEIQPDIVHLHCINGNNINVYVLLKYLATHKIKTVFTLHAEFPYTGGCGHAYDCEKWLTGCGHCPYLEQTQSYLHIDRTSRTWKKWKSCYDLFDRDQLVIIAVSPWLADRAKKSPMIGRFDIKTVLNCVDTDVFQYRRNIELRHKLGIADDEKMIFHATASFDPTTDNLKGGRYIVELAKYFVNQPVKIVVAANYGHVSDLPENLIYIGRTKDQIELAELYSEADLTVITSKRETFSMITAESLCCGTPVVGFKAGGPESIALSEHSEFVEYGNKEALNMTCSKWLRRSSDPHEIGYEAEGLYATGAVLNDYISLYTLIKDRSH